jgi:DNA repair protein RadC
MVSLDESPSLSPDPRAGSRGEPRSSGGPGPRPRPHRRPAARTRPHIATRYRLSLVREPVALYGPGADPDEAGPTVRRPAEAARFLWTHLFHDEPREVVAVVFLDVKNRATGHLIAAIGSPERCVVEPRTLLAAALLHQASGVVLAHNHPSGDPSPSPEDLAFTSRMQGACDLLGLRFVDHLILGAERRWTSLLRKATW